MGRAFFGLQKYEQFYKMIKGDKNLFPVTHEMMHEFEGRSVPQRLL